MKATTGLKVDRVVFSAAPEDAVKEGLIGFVSFRLNDRLQLDGIALRRTLDGRRVLSFPARRDSAGNQRFYVRPLDDAARRQIEDQVLAALGLAA